MLISACTDSSLSSETAEWRCSLVECAETIELTGVEWAQQNCAITDEGTLCQVNLDTGQSQIIPLDQLNLSAITATQCVKYVCVEEAPFRKVNYEIDVSAFKNTSVLSGKEVAKVSPRGTTTVFTPVNQRRLKLSAAIIRKEAAMDTGFVR